MTGSTYHIGAQSTYLYRVPQCMSSRQNWDSPTRSSAGEGAEKSQFRRLEKKLSTLPTLWAEVRCW
jgi:hypothetical protein